MLTNVPEAELKTSQKSVTAFCEHMITTISE